MRFALVTFALIPRLLFAASAGDVVAISADPTLNGFPAIPTVMQFEPSGRVVSSERSWVYAVTTDADLNLYRASDDAIEVRDRYGRFVRSFPIGFVPATMFVDRAGNLYAAPASAPVLAKFSPDGTLLRSWAFSIGRRMDLAADQCTLIYTTQLGNVMRRNLCTGDEPVSLGISTNGLRVFRDGRIVTNVGFQIRVHSLDGRLLHVAECGIFGNRLALAADGESIWLMNASELVRVRLSDGAILVRTTVGFFHNAFEFTVYGEPRGANAADPVPAIPSLTAAGGFVLIALLTLLAARKIS